MQTGQIPASWIVGFAELQDALFQDFFRPFQHRVSDTVLFQDFVPFRVDDFALTIHYVIVFEQMLSNVEVMALHALLSPGNGPIHHAGFQFLTFGHPQTLHEPHDARPAEQSHQVVFQAEVESAGTRIPLTTGTAPKLVVDSTGFVTLRAYNVQSAGFFDLLVKTKPDVRPIQNLFGLFGSGASHDSVGFLFGSIELLLEQGLFEFLYRRFGLFQSVQILHIERRAAENNVRSSAGHVGCHGHCSGLSGILYNFSFPLMLLRIQYIVRYIVLLENSGKHFRFFDGNSSHQYRLLVFDTVFNVAGDGLKLFLFGPVHAVWIINTSNRFIRGYYYHFQSIDLTEFFGLSICRSGHSG